MIDWEFGFFPVLGIMATVVVGVLAARLVYVDQQYGKILESLDGNLQREKTAVTARIQRMNPAERGMADTSDEADHDLLKEHQSLFDDEFDNAFDVLLQIHDKITKYTSHRNSNRNKGLAVDVTSLMVFIAAGVSVILGGGKEFVSLLLVPTLGFMVLSILVLVYHVRIIIKSDCDVKQPPIRRFG